MLIASNLLAFFSWSRANYEICRKQKLYALQFVFPICGKHIVYICKYYCVQYSFLKMWGQSDEVSHTEMMFLCNSRLADGFVYHHSWNVINFLYLSDRLKPSVTQLVTGSCFFESHLCVFPTFKCNMLSNKSDITGVMLLDNLIVIYLGLQAVDISSCSIFILSDHHG